METAARRFLAAPAMAMAVADGEEDVDVDRPPAKKKKKPSSAQNRLPQRGLGVEKLERLRLQERWRMMTEMEAPAIPPFEVQIQRSSIYDDRKRQHSSLAHSPFRLGFPAPVGGQNQGIMAEEAWLLQQNKMLRPGGGIGNGGAFAFPYAPVKRAIGSSSELPSSQNSSEEQRSRPKSPSAAADLALFKIIEDKNQRESETKLYEFFPCSSGSKSEEESEAPSSGVARSSKETRLDLTLKLSSQ